MSSRILATKEVSSRKSLKFGSDSRRGIEHFGHRTFNQTAMQQSLPPEVFHHIIQVMQGSATFNALYADILAKAMQDWAQAEGATHFTHWFQPLTGLTAEKHDAFIDWKEPATLIEKFSGRNLFYGEPDASSLPSGGLRKTSQARGYTSWDLTSPPFLWKSASSVILCIPSLFFSWTGEALDMKIPLMRSNIKMADAAMRLVSLLGLQANRAFTTLGCEQEYFLVDRSYCQLRPDLLLTGRTLFGAPPAKGQEFEDHYFRAIKQRVLAYIQDFEDEAYALGIPLKTRHSEVAPSQYEVAPIFETSIAAVDHNVLLMELMREVAARHDLVCLFHEKPFAGINGSGKHNNWSLGTDTGLNLFDPSDKPGNSLLFLIMLTATLSAVHEHADLLRSSVASAGNDHRLGGNEAPPPIISVYLGEGLESIISDIEKGASPCAFLNTLIDLKIHTVASLRRDHSDRNRTSPFAFTGNKFEFRAVGSSAHCAFPVTVLNVIVAQALNRMIDEIETAYKLSDDPHVLNLAAMQVIRKYLLLSKDIRFSGNGYSSEWVKEAKNRRLPIIERSFSCFSVLTNKKTVEVFENVLSKDELSIHYATQLDHYCKVNDTEAKLLEELFYTHILPNGIQYQKEMVTSVAALQSLSTSIDFEPQLSFLEKFSTTLNESIRNVDSLRETRIKAYAFQGLEQGQFFSECVSDKMLKARKSIDTFESIMDDRLWPFPKYRELLFTL